MIRVPRRRHSRQARIVLHVAMMHWGRSTIICFCFSTYQPPSILTTTPYCLAECIPIWNSWKRALEVWVLPFLSLPVRCHWSWEISVTQPNLRRTVSFRAGPSSLLTLHLARRGNNTIFHLYNEDTQLYIYLLPVQWWLWSGSDYGQHPRMLERYWFVDDNK